MPLFVKLPVMVALLPCSRSNKPALLPPAPAVSVLALAKTNCPALLTVRAPKSVRVSDDPARFWRTEVPLEVPKVREEMVTLVFKLTLSLPVAMVTS